jgi:hypothetical protein
VAAGAGAVVGVVEAPLLFATAATLLAVLPPGFPANIWRGAGPDAKGIYLAVAAAGVVGAAGAMLLPVAEYGLMCILGVDGLSPWVPMAISGGAGVIGVVAAVGALSLIKGADDVGPALGTAAIAVTAATITSVVAGPVWWSGHHEDHE